MAVSSIQNKIAPGLRVEDLMMMLLGGGAGMPSIASQIDPSPRAPLPTGADPAAVMSRPAGGLDWSGVTKLFGQGGSLTANPAPAAASAPVNPFDNYLKSWTQPGFATNWPFTRDPSQTGLQNFLAGTGNAVLNAPQNFYQGYLQATRPAATAVTDAMGGAWNWATKPENAAPTDIGVPPAPKFTPGLPTEQIIDVESGGKPDAKNPNSSAYGPGQFLRGTWLDFMREVHPDQLDVMGEDGALELRSDPQWANEATSWYAGKAVDQLDAINKPATDANIYLHHFLGPGGMKKVLTADPNTPIADLLTKEQIAANQSILGNGRTVQDVLTWAQTKMGEAEAMPPTPRPDVVMPDFSAADRWLEAAAPEQADPQLVKDAVFARMLAGIGGGLAGPVSSGGELFGNLAAGASAGLTSGKDLQLELSLDFQKQQNEYAGNRATVAEGRAGTVAAGRNAQLATEWQNAEDERTFLTEQNQAAKLAKAPKILQSSADGIWYQTPEGDIRHLNSSQNDTFGEVEKVAKALGQDSNLARQLKYNLMSQTPGTNILSMEMEIARDIITDGMGPAVFGDAYTEALAAAEEMLAPLAGTDDYQQALEKAVTGLLLGGVQQAGDFSWILQAAQMGNPGAAILVQGGTFAE